MNFYTILTVVTLSSPSVIATSISQHDGSDTVSNINNRVSLLEKSMQSVMPELKAVKDQLVVLKTELQSTKNELASVKAELKGNNLHTINTTVLDIISSDVKANSKEIAALKTNVQSTVKSIVSGTARSFESKTEAEIASLKTSISSSIAHLKAKVKYEVQLRHPISSFTTGDTLKFDTVKSNDGNGYHSSTGRFIAPVPGTYMLWANVAVTTTNANLDLTLKINGAAVARGMSHPGSIGYDNAIITYVKNLKVGDQVWYEKYYGPGHNLRGDLYSSYGGVLLSPA